MRSAFGKLPVAVAEAAVVAEQVNRRIVHADADPALVHRLHELRARHRKPRQWQERREDVPAVFVIATLRKEQWCGRFPALEVASDQRPAARVQCLELRAAARGRRGRRRRRDSPCPPANRVSNLIASASFTRPCKRCRSTSCSSSPGCRRDRAPLDRGHVLVGVEAEAHEIAEAADAAPRHELADRMRGVFDDPQLESCARARTGAPCRPAARRNARA